jgi:uncharacterized OsmC-like protein
MSQAQATAAQKTIINGLDVEALAGAGAAIVAEPKMALIGFRARTSWQGGLRSRTDVVSYDLGGQEIPRRHQIHTDEPIEILGGDSAPNPQDLLLAAVASCMMVGFVVGATNAGIRIDALSIDTACGLDMRGAFGLDPSVAPGAEKITYVVRVRGTGTAEQFAEIHNNVTKQSPNYYHLANPIRFESELIVG